MKAESPSASVSRYRFRAVRAFKALDDGERKKWLVVAAARDLPLGLPLDANARLPNVIRNRTCAEQRETLLKTPEMFQLFNSGIVCTATSVDLKQEGNEHWVDVAFDEDGQQGIVNGGHTYATLLHVLHDKTEYSDGKDLKAVLVKDAAHGSADLAQVVLDDDELARRVARAREKAQVQIEFIAPVPDLELLAKIAIARNLSQSVEATAIQNLAGRFDLMKDVLAKAPRPFGDDLVERIVWKTNQEVPEDSTAVPVKLLIHILALMNIRAYPPATRVANEVYTRSGVVVREFGESEEEDRAFWEALMRRLPEFIKLYETIYASLSEIDPKYPWADGRLDADKPRRRIAAAATPILARPCGSKVVNAFVWPIFSAFRLLLQQKANGVTFVVDPVPFFNDMKNELAMTVQSFHRNQAHGLVQQVGKDKEVWLRLQSQIEMELKLRERLAAKG
jgi:hypothetical protein